MLRAAAIAICLSLNLAFWATFVLIGGAIKLFTSGSVRRRVIMALTWLAERWVHVNNVVFDLFLTTEWRMSGLEQLRRDRHYLVVSNHISWIDIFAVQRAFNGRGPFIRFFLKQVLIWSPFLGQAAWALEFPFMRRYSREYLEKHPEKRGRDLETTRIACRRYRGIPAAILNYVEGTRFTPQKRDEQNSPYKHLLRPRVGGIAFVLASFAEQLDAIYDITVIYPKADATILDFVTNKLPWVALHARRIEVPPEFCGDAITQPGAAREHFKSWVEQLWREKDALIEQTRETGGAAAGR